MRFFLLTLSILLGAFFLQEFIPVFDWAYSSRLLLVHTAFFAIAIAVPFPAMLLLALITGFIWDARYHVPVVFPEAAADSLAQAELPFGLTIFFLGITGALIQGVRPLFRRGRWELPVFMIGLCTTISLVLEYLAISFHRGGLELPPELVWKLVMTGLFSALISPFLLLLLTRLADRTRFNIRSEDQKRKHSYDGDTI
ncbi:MAG: hypothetical protein P1U68_10840 [Verrucomicrobiales bacterium]|nr:hypothetical protein [Verrucomicrobiales bacterium]